MWWLFAVLVSFESNTHEWVKIQTEFPLMTWAECQAKAASLASESIPNFVYLKTYVCQKESV